VFFGSYVGARISLGLSPLVMKRSFSIFLVAVAARMWLSK
jgi:uncharacterized membrane protein YfcA